MVGRGGLGPWRGEGEKGGVWVRGSEVGLGGKGVAEHTLGMSRNGQKRGHGSERV